MSRALGVLVLALLVLVLPAPAGAAPWSGDDVAGDVQAARMEAGRLCAATPVEAEAATSVDITRMTVQHRPHVVMVRLRHVGADATDGRYLTLHVLTPRRELLVDVSRLRPHGRWHVFLGDEPDWSPMDFDEDGDGTPDCHGWSAVMAERTCPQSAVTVAGPLLTVALPRTCLGSPTWVRFGAAESGLIDEVVVAVDTWGTSDLVVDPNTLIYGARVRTGRGDTRDTSRTLRGPVVRRTLLQSPAGLVLPTS
ncbi:hypothetical protein [Nocardioides sp.]|uniref:hypothetical protein n=1 Tax=Nocardioides sp. TaxID=35761 RepID=UPI003784EFE0